MSTSTQSHTHLSAGDRLGVSKPHSAGLTLRADRTTRLTGVLTFLSASPPLVISGLNGDDSVAVGLRRGSVVHSYDLGSGVASSTSAPLGLGLATPTVRVGRSFRSGWLKVKSHPSICPPDVPSATVWSDLTRGGGRPRHPPPRRPQAKGTSEGERDDCSSVVRDKQWGG